MPELPKTDLVQYLVEHIDVRSFDSSLSQRRDEKNDKITFREFNFKPEIGKDFAKLKEQIDSNDNWEIDFKIISSTKNSVLVCFHDFALNGGSYNSQFAVNFVTLKNSFFVVSDHKQPLNTEACPAVSKDN